MPTVHSYRSVFEIIWFHAELLAELKSFNEKLKCAYQEVSLANKQLKVHHKMQKEFICILFENIILVLPTDRLNRAFIRTRPYNIVWP